MRDEEVRANDSEVEGVVGVVGVVGVGSPCKHDASLQAAAEKVEGQISKRVARLALPFFPSLCFFPSPPLEDTKVK